MVNLNTISASSFIVRLCSLPLSSDLILFYLGRTHTELDSSAMVTDPFPLQVLSVDLKIIQRVNNKIFNCPILVTLLGNIYYGSVQ